IVGLVGLNGAGKTTTIRAISGFLPTENVHVTGGRLGFAGRSITGLRPYQAARLGIAVVPERDKVFDTLTVRQNLEVALVGAGLLAFADHGYILESGRVVFAGTREELLRHGDVKEFYLGQREERERGYRDVKQYRRVRRWH